MSMDGYDRLSGRLIAVNSSLRLLCDMIVTGSRPKIGLRSGDERSNSQALRQIDATSAALRRVAMVMFDAGAGSLCGRDQDFFARAPTSRGDESCQARSRFEVALRFFKIACQRYQVALSWDRAAVDRGGASAGEAGRALVERELEVVVAAINRLYLAVAMIDFTALPDAAARPIAPTTY